LLALVLSACTETTLPATPLPTQPAKAQATPSGTPIKVGAIFDLTGPTSDVGTFYASGIKGYVEWKNANGGINGHPIELISADFAYKVDQAEAHYAQFAQQGVVAFQGWGTGDTEALRTKITADKIPFMSASYAAGLGDPSQAPYNFLVGTSYSDQAKGAIIEALDDWKARGNNTPPNFALIYHNSPFGKSPVADAEVYAKMLGAGFMSIAMPAGATDYVAELAQIQQFGANYVLIQNVSSPAAVLVKDAKSQGLTDQMQFICLNWCADELMVGKAGEAAEGVWGVIPFTPPTYPVPGHREAAAFLKSKGSSLDEMGMHYTQGWWTMALMAEGIKLTLDNGLEVTGENIKKSLESIQNFDTGAVTARISYSPNSHKGTDAALLYQVQAGKWLPLADFAVAP
jgi:branched-chain amino acid transport system substrate-binding protein